MIFDSLATNFPAASRFIEEQGSNWQPWLMGGCVVLAVVTFIVEGIDK